MPSIDPVSLNPLTITRVNGVPEAGSAPELRSEDIRRVRRYSRIVSALASLALLVGVLLVAWLLDQWLETPWLDLRNPRLLSAATLVAAGRFALSEARLRRYDIRLTDEAVIHASGRDRYYLPLAHLQLIDTESSPLLRPMGLSRCVLHTAGGIVTISPVPVRFVSAIERAMLEHRAGEPGAG